jgi:RNA polymerase sigma-70 factor (ECF subfamily)
VSDAQSNSAQENPIDAPIAALVRWKARSLVGRAGLTRSDREDVEQELKLRLLGPLKRFDRAKGGRMTFARTLVDRFAANIIRDRTRAKRGDAVAHEALPEEGPASADSPDPGLALDVAAAVEALPKHLRKVARVLMAESVAGAARKLRVARATIYARLREIRERAEFQKLGKNPPTSPDTSRAEGE